MQASKLFVLSLLAVALLLVGRAARADGLTLVSSTPAEGSTVAPTSTITLKFSAPIDAKMTAWVTDANGTPGANALVPQVTARVSGATATLALPPKLLHAGLSVAVLWTAQAKGGAAPQTGKLTFTVGALPSLVGSSPSPAATIGGAPDSVSLSFDRAITADATITVTVQKGGAPQRVATSAPTLSDDGKTITVALTGASSGAYHVTWEVKSTVGIPNRGMVRFTAQ